MTPARVLVVGAAIVRDGALLAARRTTRPSVAGTGAGRWELPGGKVEAGETPGDALVREVREELDCEVAVEGWLDGDQPIGATHLLRVAVCRLVDGEPHAASDHDEIRWLSPDRLEEVDWLEPDRPFLPQCRRRLLGSQS